MSVPHSALGQKDPSAETDGCVLPSGAIPGERLPERVSGDFLNHKVVNTHG